MQICHWQTARLWHTEGSSKRNLVENRKASLERSQNDFYVGLGGQNDGMYCAGGDLLVKIFECIDHVMFPV